jgi:hypothetical protein
MHAMCQFFWGGMRRLGSEEIGIGNDDLAGKLFVLEIDVF